MSNILIADANGRRRVRIETLVQKNGHHAYSVGSLAEAMRYAQIYVPEVLILGDSLPDGDVAAVISAFRSSEREMLRELPIVITQKMASGQNVYTARNNTAAELVVEAETVLSQFGAVA